MGEFRSRRRIVRLLVPAAALVALILAAAACGGSGESRSGAAVPTATRVEVNQTGGFAGVDELYTVDASVQDQRRGTLLEKVGGEQFRGLADSYIEPTGCRDAFTYEVTVTYSDGNTKHIATDECSQSPELLTEVITLTKEIGSHRSGK
ncbi:hypothetical protein NDR87_03315 [Nocardia sp. CDC159]|uniref:Lipoprotein n=1 Tax=Nocardia pulmonis TaxID=2951408 RepID=A0A9X2IWJ6_9NOCA|nr:MULTISPECIES: protealysin inhibitor emfourin [Nocardia]MCM6771956.1 hypothetical protein [Nocardia pulmonis]MCM6785386.1 hypothetical protein [Nocardia sp. CDC159]